MENWRDTVASYPDNPEPKDYGKAIHIAELILNEDLADFEIEWLAQTLLFKPVALFDTITIKRTNENWLKVVADSFKILTKIVDRYWSVVENYYNDIIKLCMLPMDVQTRKEAILCLLSVVKQPTVEIEDDVVSRQVTALEDAKNCKAPLALLVGTICQYHPEKVQEHYIRIWRTYLNMLQPSNKTDTVVSSVLQGINGLFQCFGNDLEIAQLNNFYDQMARECIKISKCLDVLLSILKHHANLFKERLAADRAIRLYLWQIETKNAMEALSSVYEVILDVVRDKETIIRTEILPRLNSPSVLVKHTACRIVIQAQSTLSAQLPKLCSGIELEFLLRVKKLSYEEAHTVSWCIESNVANSETMLLTAILFYENLPTTKKRDIVVNGILKASDDDVRKAALFLLLKLCLQDDLDKYLDVWRVLLNNRDGPDLCKAVVIFEEIVVHMLEMLRTLIQADKSYTEVRPVFSLMSILLSLHKTEYHTAEWLQSIRPSLAHLGKLVQVDPFYALGDVDENTTIITDQFEEDTIVGHLLESMTNPCVNEKLNTLQLIFTRETSELRLLSKALNKLERMFNKDNPQMVTMLNQIVKLKSKIMLDSKDGRVFQKDVAMFLGKYGTYIEKENFSDDIYVLKLRNKLSLNIPNIIEGVIYKLDLLRVLQLCLVWAEPEALYCMLVVLTANLCDRPDPGLQEATLRVIHALLKVEIGTSVAETGIYPSLLMCGTVACIQIIMKCIIEEPSPEVRRKLSECLEVLLTADPGSETAGELLKLVAEQTVFMMTRDDDDIYAPSLDIIKAFISSLKDNNSLIIKHIPDILKNLTSKTELANNIFDVTSKLYIEKIDLFTEDQIKELITKILETLSKNSKRSDICHCYKKWQTCEHVLNTQKYDTIMTFVKNVVDIKKLDLNFLIDVNMDLLKDMTVLSPEFLKILHILGVLKEKFDFCTEIRQKVVNFNDGYILRELSKIDIRSDRSFKDKRQLNAKDINGVLIFLKAFARELVDRDSEKAVQCLGSIIENISPKKFITIRKTISSCLSVYKSLKQINKLIPYYQKWTEKNNLTIISKELEKKELISEWTDDFSDIIHVGKIMLEFLELPIDVAKDWTGILNNVVTKSELKWSKIYLSDLLSISEKCLSVSEFGELLDNNFDFVRHFVGVYFERLIRKPFVLKTERCEILIDILDYFAKNFREELCQDVLDLIDYLWPTFQEKSNFDEKQSVLLNIFRLSKNDSLKCEPVKWAVALLTSEDTSLEDKMKLIATLPAGEEYSIFYKRFTSKLPVLLSEMQGNYVAPFRTLLDSLAANGDMTLLDIIISLAGGDDSSGWWDHAIDACMKSLAERENINIFNKAYDRTKSTVNLGICNRILLALLRHCSRKFCETFISSIAEDLFSILRVGFREPSNTEAYRRRVTSYAIVFNILKVAFEKLPSESLQCGAINQNAGSPNPWYFTEQACKYCVTVSTKVACPYDANDELKKACLWLQCSSYNCLSTAICRRKPNKKLYARIFDVQTLGKIVDKDAVYTFDLRAYAKYKGNKPSKRSSDAIAMSSSFTGTVRSRLFLTTLSENPLQFDLIPEEEDEEDEEEISPEFEDSPLNAYGCLTTLITLLEHVTTLDHIEWRETIQETLKSDVHVNVKWLLTQAICNAEESLKPHAVHLMPSLLKLISNTPTSKNGKNVLHELHLDIISTILKWSIEDLPKSTHLDFTIEYLINTTIEYRYRTGLHRRLLNLLNSILQLYGNIVDVKWDIFQDYCKDFSKDIIILLPIIERLLKNKVKLPDLLPLIFTNTDPKNWGQNSKFSEICGLALSLADGVSREVYLGKFWNILNGVKSTNANNYVKTLFYVQKYCKECCDFQQFKAITDLAPKIEKSKCLSILATYLQNTKTFNDYYTDMFQIISLCELFDGDLKIEAMRIAQYSLKFMEEGLKARVLKAVGSNCKSTLVAVRKEAFGVFLKAFQDLVKPEDHNLFKRKATDSSVILNTLSSTNGDDKLVMVKIFEGMFDPDDEVERMITDGVQECLSKDFATRFAELFYLIIYQSNMTDSKQLELSVCGAKLLELLLSELRSQVAFKSTKLREDGLPQSLLTYEALTKRTTTRSILTSGVTFRRKGNKASQRRQINVQMPITDIIDILLRVSKTNTQICQELCIQIMKSLQGSGRRFDLNTSIATQLSEMMKRQCNSVTPLVLEASRIFVNGVCRVDGFKESVEKLKLSLSNSEGYLYTCILYEDILLRSGDRSQFIFSMMKDETDSAMREEEFSIEGLINVFSSLSNWDDLRIQDRRQVETSLPPLWVKEENFTTALRDYFEGANKKLDYSLWFNKMVASLYSDEVTHDRMSWLKLIDKWPRRDFVISSIVEAIQWHQTQGKITGEIDSNSCLVEWAGRLMVRRAMMSVCDTWSQESDMEYEWPGSVYGQELSWCKEANRRSLPTLALQCVERNQECLTSNQEIVRWVHEKAEAYRTIGLKENNFDMLNKALEATEKQIRLSSSNYVPDVDKLLMQKLVIKLQNDLGLLSVSKLDDIMQEINNEEPNSNEKRVLSCIYDMIMIFYDDQWVDHDEVIQNELISKMIDIINRMIEHNLCKESNLLISVLLNRLLNYDVTMSDVTAMSFVKMINRIYEKLDFFSVDIVKKVISVLPSNVVNNEIMSKLKDKNVDACKEYFQLLCDPNYSLLQFCDSLRKNVFEDTEWNKMFKTMKDRLFEITSGGSDYQSLNTLKNRLYALQDMTSIDAKATELKQIMDELRIKPQRPSLRLSQLSPNLCAPSTLCQKKIELQRLLRLPSHVYVVKFYEQIAVFTDSIRRPCVIKCLLSNGITRRFIVKTGEPMLKDASLQRAIAVLSKMDDKLRVTSYNVTPLKEDSAIMEYLEDHIRLRDLMEETHDINNIPMMRVPADKLILAPSLALEQFNNMCESVTPYILRSSIENNSSCIEEFISKKRTFENTLSSMTIINWIFGVGDRHLQNIMYNIRDGSVCGVDWASVFQYGVNELPPARLTANLLAVCDVKVLESRLQTMMSFLRESNKLYGSFIKTSFYWLGPDFNELKPVMNILEGKTVSYAVTRSALEESEKKNKYEFVRLLDSVFESFNPKDIYSVEEQVSCLLQQCTQPRILSVTPQGWEAWL